MDTFLMKINLGRIATATFLTLLCLPGFAQHLAQTQTAEKNTSTDKVRKNAPPAEATALQKNEVPVLLSIGKSIVLPIEGAISRVSIANPEIADITLIRSSELYAVGKRSGSTNIFLWKKSGELVVMDVIVNADTAGLIAKLRELMPSEDQIRVSSAGETLVLLGQVADAVKVQRAVLIAEQFTGKRVINLLGIGEVPQVLLEVKVAEVSKKLTDKIGVAWGFNGANGSFSYAILGNLLTGGILSTPAGSGGGISATRGNDSIKLEAEIKNGLIKILAEPNIIAVSGQEGAFLAGGKIFIPVPQTSGGGTTITLEEREYGVGLRFLPTVLEGGKINLRVTPEVSELAIEGTRVTSGNNTTVLPTISTRRASTTVQLMDGQSFAIGGLIKNNVTETISGFPFLSEIPVIGALFRSSEFISDRSELMFLVTPRLVKPLAKAASLPTDRFVPPSRSEFMLNGQLEGSSPPTAPLTPRAASPETPLADVVVMPVADSALTSENIDGDRP
ncbi:MAG: type II and III secretion system protein family protein [Betaproteobacteria bacterium]|nr:type II and III secretion system protein family protein [Betaproteobacteria bacterium]